MKKRIISIDISILSYQNAIQQIIDLAKKKVSSYFCFTNAHMSIEAQESNIFQKNVNNSTASFADGVPIAKACKLIHGIQQERIAGMDIFPDLLTLAEKERLGVFLFGGKQDVLDAIKKRISKELPNLSISGIISPPYNVKWDNQVYINQINTSGANLCFVALGCPKQENWMAEHSKFIQMPLLGVGGAFPVYSQIQKRCPNWMAKNGLEWMYRLYQEPKRLFKRYLITNSKFLFFLFKQKIMANV